MASLNSFLRNVKYLLAIGLVAPVTGCYSNSPPTKTASSATAVASAPAVDGATDETTSAASVQPLTPDPSPMVHGEGREGVDPKVQDERRNGLGASNASNSSEPLPRRTNPEDDSKPRLVAEGKLKIEAKPPLHLEEILQRIDLRKLPFMAGNSRTGAGVGSYGFSGTVSEKFTVDSVMKYLDKLLTDSGCVRDTDPKLEYRDATGAERFYWHGDLLLAASCGISRGDSGPDINAGIMNEGNVDIRTLPTPPGAKVLQSKPHSLKLSSSQEILELRKFYSSALRELGWIEYRDYLPGIRIAIESQLPHQRFLRNGVDVSFDYREASGGEKATGKFVAFVNSGILEYEPTLPGDAESVQLRQSRPITMAFETKLSPHDLRAFLDKAYAAQGHSFDKTPLGSDAMEFKATYSHLDKISLTIEGERHDTTTIVVANEVK